MNRTILTVAGVFSASSLLLVDSAVKGTVLPVWAGISPDPVVATSPPSMIGPADGVVELPQHADPVEVEQPSATAYQPAAELPDSRPALVTPEITSEPAVWS